jgi:Leucine-rich repeat (LRR) protein
MAEPQQPTVNERLDTVQKFQAYMNSCPAGLTKLTFSMQAFAAIPVQQLQQIKFPSSLTELNLNGNYLNADAVKQLQFPPSLTILILSNNSISNLEGIKFPIGLIELVLHSNAIQSTNLQKAQFPPTLKKLNLSNQGSGNKQLPPIILSQVQWPQELVEINLGQNKINLSGAQFPPSLKKMGLASVDLKSDELRHYIGLGIPRNGLTELDLSRNLLTDLKVSWPPELTTLILYGNQITSLERVQFPSGLTTLTLFGNQITSLEGAQFPIELKELQLNSSKITTLEGVQFPPGLMKLHLNSNAITSLQGAQFPPGLTKLDLMGNPLTSLTGMIDPNDYVKTHLKQQFPELYMRDLHSEKAAAKAARQSQKAELRKMNDLSQHSMQIQLRAVTSFLREGMAARAQQHADQMLRDKQDKPTTYEESVFYAKLGKKTYPIPMNEELLVQDVLDYLNEHYYISVLHDCGDMHLHKPGVGNLDSGRTLKDCGVVSDVVLHIQCGSQTGGFRRSKKRNNKRPQKFRNTSNKNGHKRK